MTWFRHRPGIHWLDARTVTAEAISRYLWGRAGVRVAQQ
jgi:hypothetical protein